MTIGFNVKNTELKRNLLAKQTSTSAIYYGRTGSGKTSCAILPNIEDRIKSDYGLLIYDFKGNLHAQVKHLAKKHNKLDSVIEIGKPWGKKINLCDYLSIKQISAILDGATYHDQYWTTASKNLFEAIYTIYKNLHFLKEKLSTIDIAFNTIIDCIEDEISYKTLFKIVSSAKNVSQFYKDSNSSIESIEEYTLINEDDKEIYGKLKRLKKAIAITKESLTSLSLYENVRDTETGGKNAVVNHLSSIMNSVASKEFLNENEIDIIKELRSEKIIVIDVANLNENILNTINLCVYSRLQRLNSKSKKPVSIVIDEAHKILSPKYLPEVDVCRESNFEYIFATQDPILLINKLGENKFDELCVNIIEKYSFNTDDYNYLKKFEYINMNTNKTSIIKEPLFINEESLFDAEYTFQRKEMIYGFAEYKNDKKYILISDEKLIEDFKVIVQNEKGEQETVPYTEDKEIFFQNLDLYDKFLVSGIVTEEITDYEEIDLDLIEEDEQLDYFNEEEYFNEVQTLPDHLFRDD